MNAFELDIFHALNKNDILKWQLKKIEEKKGLIHTEYIGKFIWNWPNPMCVFIWKETEIYSMHLICLSEWKKNLRNSSQSMWKLRFLCGNWQLFRTFELLELVWENKRQTYTKKFGCWYFWIWCGCSFCLVNLILLLSVGEF